MLLPDAQLALVVNALYDDATNANWLHLPARDRSACYTAWVEDPRVGGILTRYMPPEAARAWIKDGPMKEYGRSVRGAGRYARFGRSSGMSPQLVVDLALGAGWGVIEATTGVKPFHVQARNSADVTVFLAWGDVKNFKNVLWAALRASVKYNVDAHVVVASLPGVAVTRDTRDEYAAMAKRCGLKLHFVQEQIGGIA